jgi:hypothetical protein
MEMVQCALNEAVDFDFSSTRCLTPVILLPKLGVVRLSFGALWTTVPLTLDRAISAAIFRLKVLARRPIRPTILCMEFSRLDSLIEQHG